MYNPTGITAPKPAAASGLMDEANQVTVPAGLGAVDSLTGDSTSGFLANFGTVPGYTEDNMGR